MSPLITLSSVFCLTSSLSANTLRASDLRTTTLGHVGCSTVADYSKMTL